MNSPTELSNLAFQLSMSSLSLRSTGFTIKTHAHSKKNNIWSMSSTIFLFQSFQRFNRICFFDDHPIRTTCPAESWKPGERRGVSKNTSKGSKIGTAGTALISKSLKDFGQTNTICHWIPRVFAQSHWLAAASFLIKGILQAASWFTDFCSDWQQTWTTQ